MMKIMTSYMQLVSLFNQMDLAWPTIMIEYFDYTAIAASMSDRLIECASKKVQSSTGEDVDEVSFFYETLFMLTPIWVTLGCGLFWAARSVTAAPRGRCSPQFQLQASPNSTLPHSIISTTEHELTPVWSTALPSSLPDPNL